MIIVASLLIGLFVRMATGRGLKSLSESGLRGESLLVALLLVQVAAPMLHPTGSMAKMAFFGWLATFPLMAVIAWMNRREPGMAILGIGLVLNFAVIAINGGMPVFGSAVALASGSHHVAPVPASDFIHLVGSVATHLPWLSDVIPLPGPTWLRLVASPGDLLLLAGIVCFVAGAPAMRPVTARLRQ